MTIDIPSVLAKKRPMVKPWEELIEQITTNDQHHCAWLNALSYLEYIGYRKMVKALPFESIKPEQSHHLSDEIQHSLMFKQLAQKHFAHDALVDHNKIQGMAEEYFQTLDLSIKDCLQQLDGFYDPYKTYLYVSYIIEIRAMQVYNCYSSKLDQSPIKLVLQKIIQDESEHLRYVKKTIEQLPKTNDLDDADLLALESPLFDRFISTFKTHILQ